MKKVERPDMPCSPSIPSPYIPNSFDVNDFDFRSTDDRQPERPVVISTGNTPEYIEKVIIDEYERTY